MKNGYHDDIITEVRRNRAKLLEMYGGIEGLHKHMKKERPELEKQGWHFISVDDFSKINKNNISEMF